MIINGFPTGVKIYTVQASALNAATVTNDPNKLTVSWINPTNKKFVGTMIRYKLGGYPSSPTDGTQAYMGTGTSVTVSGLSGGTKYYFRAFAKAANTSGSKVFYNTDTTGAQAVKETVCTPITLSVTARTTTSLTIAWNASPDQIRTVYITRKAGSYPTAYNDGTILYSSSNTSAGSLVDTGLSGGTTYYYRAFLRNNDGAWNTNTSQQISGATRAAAGQVVITSSQTWVVPNGVSLVDVFLVGGGAGTSYGYDVYPTGTFLGGYAGCGGGYTKTQKNVACTPGSSIPIAVGAGGNGLANRNGPASNPALLGQGNGGKGGTSSVTIGGTTYSAEGGNAPKLGNMGDRKGASGGSGGGGGGQSSTYKNSKGGDGGSDGSAGVAFVYHPGQPYPDSEGGAGQGTTTRAFAEAGNTLYAGGGGGGLAKAGGSGTSGSGGAGGGGRGSLEQEYLGSGGTPNTGGGAGCAGNVNNFTPPNVTNGGSGVVIIRWGEQG